MCQKSVCPKSLGRRGFGTLVTLAVGLIVVCVLLTATWLPAASAPAAAKIVFNPAEKTILVSDILPVDFEVRDASNLWAADIQVSFDTSVLEVKDDLPIYPSGVQITPGWAPQPDQIVKNVVDNVAGTIWYATTSFSPTLPFNGNGTTATAHFIGKAVGTSNLSITYHKYVDRSGYRVVFDPDPNALPTVAGRITVTTGSLGDEVWFDYDGDVTRAITEPGITSATLRYYSGSSCTGSSQGSQLTPDSGSYQFTGLNAGNYCVEVVTSTLPAPDNVVNTNPRTRTAVLGWQTALGRDDLDFGLRGRECGIAGSVFLPQGGDLSRVRVYLWWDSDGSGGQPQTETDLLLASQTPNTDDGTYYYPYTIHGNYIVQAISPTVGSPITQTQALTPHECAGGASGPDFDFTRPTAVVFGQFSARSGDVFWPGKMVAAIVPGFLIGLAITERRRRGRG